MRRNFIETFLGALVLLVAFSFLLFAYTSRTLVEEDGYYTVQAKFLKVGGIQVGSDVRISGIRVGSVIEQFLDPLTYDAVIKMAINSSVKLTSDTEAAIISDGFLGDKYIDLKLGASKDEIVNGGSLEKTKDFKSMEDLIGEIIYLVTD